MTSPRRLWQLITGTRRMGLTKSTVGAVSTKPSKPTNEDYGKIVLHPFGAAMALADGVGSSPGCALAAELAVETFLARLGEVTDPTVKAIRSVWSHVASAIQDASKQEGSKYAGSERALETTLLTVIDSPEQYIISYLGNGSVWLVRGDFWQFLPTRWPWPMTDLLVGHTSLDPTGREALYGVLSNQGASDAPRFITVSKDLVYGEFLILTTDGISSADHLRLGRDSSDQRWIEVNPHFERFIAKHLVDFLARLTVESSLPSLDDCLKAFLDECTFEDDATIGVVASEAAVNYYRSKDFAGTK